MSWHRENVIWQSKNGTWNRGFYTVLSSVFDSDDPDYDPEWDVDYDYSSFWWARTGLGSEEAARRSWDGANPGSWHVVAYTKKNAKHITELDLMAKFLLDPAFREAYYKKKRQKHNREHFTKLREQFITHRNYVGSKVIVTVKESADDAYSPLGVSTTHTGVAETVGDWVVVGKVKLINVKTNRFNRRLHKVEFPPLQRSYRYGW